MKRAFDHFLNFIQRIRIWIFFFTLPSLLVLTSALINIFSGDKNYIYNLNQHQVQNVTQLYNVSVNQAAQPSDIEELISLVNQKHDKISIGGGRYSQGGQIAYPNSLHIDMRKMNDVLDFSAQKKKSLLKLVSLGAKLSNTLILMAYLFRSCKAMLTLLLAAL